MALVYWKPNWLRRSTLILTAIPLFFVYIAAIAYKGLKEDMPLYFSDLVECWKGRNK